MWFVIVEGGSRGTKCVGSTITGWNDGYVLAEAGDMRITLVACPTWPIDVGGAAVTIWVVCNCCCCCCCCTCCCWCCWFTNGAIEMDCCCCDCRWICWWAGRTNSGRITCPLLYITGLGVFVLVLYFAFSDCAGLPIGINTFWRLPTVSGDWLTTNGDDPWPVGDEKAGVAERELLSDTNKDRKRKTHTHFSLSVDVFHVEFMISRYSSISNITRLRSVYPKHWNPLWFSVSTKIIRDLIQNI